MVHDIKQKIVCSGNPDGHPDDHTWQHTVAYGVREHLPDTKFVHSSNGYDLRLWDDKRRNSFVDLIKDSTVFINASKIYLVRAPNSSGDFTNGFLFAVKNGNVDGEKMKGQYMMTKLTTEHPGVPYLSRYKFNLYGANVDIDKSELSNK